MPEQDGAPRTWRAVLEHIERRLAGGHLAPGDRLNPERELAAELGVGRSSVREALRVLEAMGLIRTATGSGPNAGAFIVAAADGGMQALLRLQVAAQVFPVTDIVDTRLVLEGAVVESLALAAPGRTAEAHRILDRMDAAGLTSPEFLAFDAQLHLALAEASGNTVIAAMMAGLRTAIESYVVEGAAAVADWPAMADRLRAEHRAVVAAVDDGDAHAARALIHQHITGYHAATGLVPAAGRKTPEDA